MLDKGRKSGEKVTTDDRKLKACGRNRFCKQCKFTCTDPKDFLTHQKYAHSQEKDPDILNSISKRRKSSSSNHCTSQGSLVKKTVTRSSVSHDSDEKLNFVNGRKSDSNTFQPTEDPLTLVNSEVNNSSSEDEAVDSMNKENQLVDNNKRNSFDDFEKIDKENMDSAEMEHASNFGSEHEEQDEEGKLIIAEDDHLSSKTPTRSGNIQNRTYVCNQCEFSSTSAKTFLHHQKDEHQPDIIIYECDICEYATKYKQKLPRHRKLHFTGKENSSLLGGYDLESSLNESKDRSGSFNESMKMDENNPNFVRNVVDDDEDDDEEEEEEETLPQSEAPEIVSMPDGTPHVEKKKRKTRQEVDPGKYFEVQDDTGIKYACSKCGNVYKWRKSLNKHWKEKHFGDIPDSSVPPPGLAKLNSLNHVQYTYRFPTPKGMDRMSPSSSQRGERSRSETPVSMVERYQPGAELLENSNMSSVVMPRFIGPFITDSLAGDDHSQSKRKSEALFPRMMDSSREQPIDFSVKKENEYSPYLKGSRSSPSFNNDQAWSEQTSSLDLSGNKKEESPILQCNRCSFVAKTLVDYSSHMTLHLNKRAFKCAECQEHFNNVEDLNKHFGENHAEKIHEHKEAIQKIPHGLQQTYHLLKMPLNAIGSIAVSEASTSGPSEPKYLKCSMCSFVAKWPAELQKHAVSHSEERPFVCMVCGSTYKWKWDLVKHFEKSHNSLTNPYKRREQGSPAPLNMKPEQSSGMKSPPVLSPVPGFHGDRPMYPMTSTAAALIDTDTFHKRSLDSMSYEEPFRKKRRLSDTDMPNLMDQSQSDSQEYITAGSLGYEQDDSRANESASNDSQNSFRMSGASALRDMENLIPPEDEKGNDPNEMFGTCAINPQTQMAVINAVKKRMDNGKQGSVSSKSRTNDKDKNSDILLPYKCQICEYRARWPSEITQHMKNHSDEKPYHCPRCSYKSKWKWDVVKHLKRCGGGTIRDVIDTNKIKKHSAPPNVTVMPQGSFQRPGLTSQANSSQRNAESRFSISSVAEALASNNSAIMSMADMNKANYEDYEKIMSLSSSQQPIFKSIINQGVYHCFECPFVAQSPAELKRHAVLHSENKPFSCTICGYSSRWKCDLKKHIRTYGHYDQSLHSKSSQQSPSDKFQYQIAQRDIYQDDQDSEDRTLYKCNKCVYSTFKKYSFEIHMKIHGDIKKEDGSSGKYNCKQCDFQGADLISLLQHKKTHTGKPTSNISAMEQSNEQVSNRTLQKHRRKPVQQFRCPKCPYTCFKRSGLTMHEAMHQPRGEDALKCYYCDYNVFSKGLLVQHMRLHPEFDPNECSEFAEILENNDFDNMDTEEDEYLRNMNDEDLDDYSMMDEDSRQSPNDLNSSGSSFKAKESGALDLSSSSFTSIANDSKKASMFEQPDSPASQMQFPCEWCSSRFPNLTTLYHHASTRHPMELRLQELGESPSMALPTRMNDPYLERQKRLQQKQELQNQELEQHKMQLEQHFQTPMMKNAMNQSRYRPIEPKLPFSLSENTSPNPVYSSPSTSSPSTSTFSKISQDANNNKSGIPISQSSTLVAQALLAKAKKSTSPNKRGRSFQCTKCSFTAPNAVTYLRHIERHGSNCRHTCRFCDYSIDRLNLLYQHMKGTHGDLWRGTPEEKINLTSSSGGKGYSDEMRSTDMNSDSMNNSLDGSFTGSSTESSEISDEAFNFSMNEIRVYHTMAAKGQNPVLTVKEETTWYGIPIQVCSINGRKSYKCPKCMYVNSNPSNTVNHVKFHGSNKRLSCDKCDIGVDNMRQLEIHYECLHPKNPIFIERSPSRIPFVSEAHNSVEENNNFLTWSKLSQKTSNLILPTCTKCPYKCRTVEMLQYHLTLHNLSREFKCNYCEFSVDSQNLLLKHLGVHREPYEPDLSKNEEEEIKAANLGPTSQNQFLSKIDLMPSSSQKEIKEIENKLTPQTLKTVLNNLKNSTGRLRYRCARCPYFSFCKNNISKHHKQHIIKSKFKCQYCDYSATRNFLRLQHMKFHDNSDLSDAKSADYQDIILDPYDEDGLKVLSSIQTPESTTSTNSEDNIKDFSDENNEYTEETDAMMEVGEDFDEEEMAALEQAEFEGLEEKKTSDVEMEIQDSDDSLSEMDPSALQQQMSMNLSGSMASEEKIRYTCSQCPYKCNALRSFKCHIHMHGLNKKYICDYCNWSADRLNLLYQHRKVHLKEPNFNPSPEDIVFLNRNFALENDVKSLMSPEDISIDKQKKNSSPVDERALQRMSDRQFAGKKIYGCKLCPFSCNNKNSFAYHKNLHKIDARYTCNQCSYSIDRWNLLAQHMKLHKISNMQGQDRSNTDEMNASSPEVEPQLYFNAGDSLNGSEVESEEEKAQDWKCSRCPYSATSPEKLKEHSQQHHKHSKHSCPYCDFSDSEEGNMLEHVQLHFPSTKLDTEAVQAMLAKQGGKLPHSPEVPVVKSFRRDTKKSESDSVEREPSNEAPKSRTKVYVCPYCEREFDNKDLMLKHERQHLIGSKY